MLTLLAQAQAQLQGEASPPVGSEIDPTLVDPAQVDAGANILVTLRELLFSGNTLTDARQLAETVQPMSLVWATVFLVVGLTTMLNGYKYYRFVTVLLAMTLGSIVGYYLGDKIGAAYIVAGCASMLVAVTCFPLMKYAVALLGGLAGAFIGANVWVAVARLMFEGAQADALAKNAWVGALVGLITIGMLAFILFKLTIILFTSVSGSTLAVIGALALLIQVPNWRTPIVDSIAAHPIVVPLLILVPAVIGLLVQETESMGQAGKKPGKPAPA